MLARNFFQGRMGGALCEPVIEVRWRLKWNAITGAQVTGNLSRGITVGNGPWGCWAAAPAAPPPEEPRALLRELQNLDLNQLIFMAHNFFFFSIKKYLKFA